MAIWDICIRRPVFTTMLVLAPIVLGMASYSRLGVELFPNVDVPVVVVTTTLKGASVDEMESAVTKPIEEVVNTVSGIDELRSTTREGFTQIVVGFKLEKNGDIAAQELRDKLSTLLPRLPVGTDPPVVEKFNLDAAPIITLAVSGRRSLREITEIAKKQIKEDLEAVSGVGACVLVGGQNRAINVWADPDRLRGRELSIEDVRQALVRQNLELPGGRVDSGSREEVLRTLGRVQKSEDFADIIVAQRTGYPVRISDIGNVEDGVEEPRTLSRLDGDLAVSLIIQKQSGGNTVKVAEAVLARLEEIRPLLPADIRVEVIRNQSKFIKSSIDEVKFHLFLAAALVSATLLLFIRDWRTTLIAATAVPTSLIGVFAVMDVMGFSLNTMTLIGLIMAVGIVIDDAVVILENIVRHIEEVGRTPWEAASVATKEIGLAVLATTLSLAVIFAPIAFMSGQVGRFFNSFGWVVGVSVLLSMAVSFTLTPMLCARFLKVKPGTHGKNHGGGFWGWVAKMYVKILAWCLGGKPGIGLWEGFRLWWKHPFPWPYFPLREWLYEKWQIATCLFPKGWHRFLVLALAFGCLMSTPIIAEMVGTDFVPKDDQSEFEVALTMPEGYTLDRSSKAAAEIEEKLKSLRGIVNIFTTVGETSGRQAKGQGEVTPVIIYCRLTDLKERNFSQWDVIEDARAILADYPDYRPFVQEVNLVGSSAFKNVQLEVALRGPDSQVLETAARKLLSQLRNDPRFPDIDTNVGSRNPELQVRIDREKAADLGVSVATIAGTLQVLVGGEPVSKYKDGVDQYDVWLRAGLTSRDSPTEVSALTVPTDHGKLVELGNLAKLTDSRGPSAIERYNRQRYVSVQANFKKGTVLGKVLPDVSKAIEDLDLPPGYRHEFLGEAKLMADSNSNFAIAFLLAFAFMYMILAAQFESFVHPITILMAVPLTLPFALISLWFLRTPLDVYAMIGLFMLFGIVKKNGILQVDYTNVLRAKGLNVHEAILQANETRLRPILMTTIMLVAAMIPIATGQGPGASARASMAKVILGGQMLSLLLSLLVTPVAYSVWDDLAKLGSRMRKWFRRKEPSKPVSPEPVVVSLAADDDTTVNHHFNRKPKQSVPVAS
jgi:HAE1 family hydrophobic/amphiphilic exporter-1